ncbi:toxin-activating lysine-acyltransferase [Pectobacterium aroidearum]|uniref:toxin-activating lysine-acyltransferase n=1 Tax=Pectobacterium aroidearum TaxID=1201031 RepID=UPI0015F02A01|nr:toxin-activating lysine-acyltransferase [Pectobacterium aroidearum]MBA5235638.1 toxin-activating lysine-acyltransferase [Pectobacterium aroidearum]
MEFIKKISNEKINTSDYEKLGFAVACMLMNRNYSLYHIKILQQWTQKAISHNQFKVFFNNTNHPIGYMTWAFLREDTLSRLSQDPLFLLHDSEWDEGGTLCIMDFCCKPGSAIYCINDLKKLPPINTAKKVVWRSRKTGKILCKDNTRMHG